MKKVWIVDIVDAHLLQSFLNDAERRGGTIFQVLDGPETRRSFVTVVWFTEAANTISASTNARPRK